MTFLLTIILLTSSGHSISILASSKQLIVELKGARIKDLVEAFFSKELLMDRVSRLCSVKTGSVSIRLYYYYTYKCSFLYCLSIFLAKYSLVITSFSFWVKMSNSETASFSQGWLRISQADSRFLGSTLRIFLIRSIAWSLSLSSLKSYFPWTIFWWSSYMLVPLKGTVPISIA